MSKLFSRTIEDFKCERCGREVNGSGYTNHCPNCLWSKHVDKNPGDRQESCKGMMEPKSSIKEGKEYVILHECVKCGFKRKNKMVAGDSFDSLIGISKKSSQED